jgi:microsomal dipeptidase-like Zn-dependent dipeptidase
MVRITEALLEADFREDEIRKVMGGNAFRVLAETLPDPA